MTDTPANSATCARVARLPGTGGATASRLAAVCTVTRVTDFHRDRVTWVAYAVLAWFAFLQASPGLIVGRLREELDLGYTTGGLHIAAFAAGALAAGVAAAAPERAVGRRASLWSAVAVLAV